MKEALKLALEALEMFCEHGAILRPIETRDAIKEALAQPEQELAIGDVRALKHRIHELEGELLGYKKIVADQDALLEQQTARIVDLQTHIETFDGEDR